jgi:hypothetical protein
MTSGDDPRNVVDLIGLLTCEKWPVLDVETIELLKRHSCDVLIAHQAKERRIRVGRWHHTTLDLWGTWIAGPADGACLSIILHNESEPNARSLPSFDSLVEECSGRFGVPAVRDRNPLSPRSLWCRGTLVVSIDAYAGDPRRALTQVTIEPARIAFAPPRGHPGHLQPRV